MPNGMVNLGRDVTLLPFVSCFYSLGDYEIAKKVETLFFCTVYELQTAPSWYSFDSAVFCFLYVPIADFEYYVLECVFSSIPSALDIKEFTIFSAE